jgi:hypothetical protein
MTKEEGKWGEPDTLGRIILKWRAKARLQIA